MWESVSVLVYEGEGRSSPCIRFRYGVFAPLTVFIPACTTPARWHVGFQIYVAAAKKGSQGAAAAAAKDAPATQLGKGKKGKVGHS